jgi:hypothetical protein
LLAAFALVPRAAADTILLSVDPAIAGKRPATGFFDFPFANLNGASLDGRRVTADFRFADGMIGRSWQPAEDHSGFFVGLVVQTDGKFVATDPNSHPGFVGPGSTGFLLGPGGAPLWPQRAGGGASPSGGWFDAGLGVFEGVGVHGDIFEGVHFDVIFPNTGYGVTGAKIEFYIGDPYKTAGEWDGLQFGTLAQVPEPATIVLLALGLVVMGVAVKRESSRRVVLPIFLAVLALAPAAAADTMYSYVGDAFRTVSDVYTLADRITGSFTVRDDFTPTPLAGGGDWRPGLLSYRFTDGHQVLTDVNRTT